MCLVGAVQSGPDTYQLDFLDNTGVITRYTLKPEYDAFKFY